MHLIILATFLEISRTVVSMCGAGIVLFLIASWAAKTDVAQARGLDKVVALSNLCFAVPLAVFGALHLSAAQGLMTMVPAYMPWRLFWAYFVGFALIAASLSIATRIQVRWSGLLFGIMMVLFVAMLHVPRALASPQDRFAWTIVIREMSFAGGGWILAGEAMREHGRGQGGSKLITVGRVLVAIAAIFFGVENFLHTANVPGVPLEKLMPVWIPAHAAHRLSDGRDSLCRRGGHPDRKKNSDSGNVSGHLACAGGLVHLRTDPDCGAGRSEHRDQS